MTWPPGWQRGSLSFSPNVTQWKLPVYVWDVASVHVGGDKQGWDLESA